MNSTEDKNAPANEPKFRAGDRVVRVVPDSFPPEGVKGTVLGAAGAPYEGRWEVEYDGYPCTQYGRSGAYSWERSSTSWLSRETAIELTTEEALKRVREAA